MWTSDLRISQSGRWIYVLGFLAKLGQFPGVARKDRQTPVCKSSIRLHFLFFPLVEKSLWRFGGRKRITNSRESGVIRLIRPQDWHQLKIHSVPHLNFNIQPKF